MTYEVIKSKIENINIEEKYFDIPIHKKDYPSCYQYNVLIMLAKRLIKEEKARNSIFSNRLHLDRKFVKRIFSSEE